MIFFWLFLTHLPSLLRSCNLFNDYCDTMENQCGPVSPSLLLFLVLHLNLFEITMTVMVMVMVMVTVQEEECLRRRRSLGEVMHRDQRDMAGKVNNLRIIMISF